MMLTRIGDPKFDVRLMAVILAWLPLVEVYAEIPLPDDVRADQYLLAATSALEQGDLQAAATALESIEALDVVPPPEFRYFFGKVLIDLGGAQNDPVRLDKGVALLNEYILKGGRNASHYRDSLQALNRAEEYRRVIEREDRLEAIAAGRTQCRERVDAAVEEREWVEDEMLVIRAPSAWSSLERHAQRLFPNKKLYPLETRWQDCIRIGIREGGQGRRPASYAREQATCFKDVCDRAFAEER